MIRPIVLAACASLISAGFWWAVPGHRCDPSPGEPPPHAPPPATDAEAVEDEVAPVAEPSTTEVLRADFRPEDVFSRALWRRPDPSDRILHAGRCEWLDSDGVSRWRSFLAVQPGPALREWLATNPFSLATVASLDRDHPDPPDWFPAIHDGYRLQQSASGNLVILTHDSNGTVYLADHGSGFTRPTQSPADPPEPGRRE
jgi:hypothetical protein